MEWMQALLSWEWTKVATSLGIAGILAGISKSLTDHWLGQRKDRTAYRRARIEEWRSTIRMFDWPDIGNMPAYAELRRHMRKDVISTVEHPRMFIIPGGRGDDPIKQRLLDEVARIEQAWKLI